MAWLFKQPGSQCWWLGWRVNGRLFRKSTGETDRKEAQTKLEDHNFLSRQAAAGRLNESLFESFTGKPLSQLSLKSAIDDWLNECKGATSPGTLERYQVVADDLIDYLKATPQRPLLRDVGSEELQAFLAWKRAKASAATVNLNRKILSTFFLRAIRNRLLRENPILPVRPFKASRDEHAGRRALTLTEIRTLHDKAPDDFWRFMIVAGYTTGLRLGDLATIRWGAVDLAENLIRVTTRKTGRVMQIPIAAPLRALLQAQRTAAASTKPAAFIWPEQAERYQQHGAKVLSNEFYAELLVPSGLAAHRTHKKQKQGRAAARDVGISFHCLRHSFVSTLKLTGASQSVAKELAGHSSDAVSQLYTHTPQQALADAIDKLPWK